MTDSVPMPLWTKPITYNEERNIACAIESLRCADEILVVDSGSNDRTVEIAGKLGARILDRNWIGYADQKNWAADQAKHDWILSIDADEAVSEMLEAEIWQLKKNGASADAYTMPRLAQYLGRWVLHSAWHPDRKIRLYDRRAAQWEGKFVHEGLAVKGKVEAFPLHLPVAIGALADDGPLHDAGGRAVGRTAGQNIVVAAFLQTVVGVQPDVFPQTRVQGRR